MKLKIREIRADDHEQVKQLAKILHDELRSTYIKKSTINSSQQNEVPYFRIVGLMENEIVSLLTYELHSNHIYFGSFVVKPTYRRTGLARQMMEHLESVAQEKNIDKIKCSTILETGNLIKFEKLGFKISEQFISEDFESLNSSPVTEILLEKSLN